MNVQLVDRQLLIRLGDPWDLGEFLRWQPLSAIVISAKADERGGALLLRISNPFIYKEMRCEYFVASPRHEDSTIEDLAAGGPVLCAITRVPEDRIEAEDPFDLSWWRGGVAAIAEIETV
jgi:hypothetical protein